MKFQPKPSSAGGQQIARPADRLALNLVARQEFKAMPQTIAVSNQGP